MPNRSPPVSRRPSVEPSVSAAALEADSLPDADALTGGSVLPGMLQAPQHNRVGSGRYIRASMALFLAGFATFSLLYCPQPLLPTLSRVFDVDAAGASLAVSLSTAAIAPAIVIAAILSDLNGRRAVMAVSMVVAAALNLGVAAAPAWWLLLALRAFEGLALGGVPAVAMTYLAEETDARGLGLAMGIYVGSTAVGGMSGRVITGLVADAFSWRVAFATIGVIGLGTAAAFLLLLPPSRHFRPRTFDLPSQLAAFGGALREPRLLLLYAYAFVLMGGFVTVYNYAGFRLEAPPYGLDQAQEGLIFTLYLLGTVGSTLAGTLADRIGRAPVMALGSALGLAGIAVSAFAPLWSLVLGIALVTFGFFAGHAVASGTVGGLAGRDKAQAASLYLLSYYIGSSVLGTAGGHFWTVGRWPAVASFVGVLFAGAMVLAAVLTLRPATNPPRSTAP